MLPIVLDLFEGLGPKHAFVRKCSQGLNEVSGAKESLRNNYLKKIFDDETISKAFVENYSFLDNNLTGIITAAYDVG
jgi:hypothetical protein